MLDALTASACIVAALVFCYLVRVNALLKGVPEQVRKVSGPRWTAELLKSTYEEIQRRPVGIDYEGKLPPRLDRRYIITGGNGEMRVHAATTS